MQHLGSGELSAAEGLFRQVLHSDPDHPVALHFLGIVAYRAGKADIAVDFIDKALTVKPDYAEAHSNLGAILRALGRFEKATFHYRHALAIKPDFLDASFNLGNLLKDQGKLEEAAATFGKILTLKPDHAEAHNNLGNTLKDLGKRDGALTSYRQAIASKPDFTEAHFNLGNELKNLGQLEQAVDCFAKTIGLKPDHAEAHNSLGTVHQDQGKFVDAIAGYRQALALKPEFAEAHNNLGTALKEQGKTDEALAHYQNALDLKPNYPDAHNNLGNVLYDLGQLEAAIECYDLAGFASSKAKSLECLYHLQKYETFNRQLRVMATADGSNIRVAAISAFAAHQLDQDNPYPFCTDPLGFIHLGRVGDHTDNSNDFLVALAHELLAHDAVWEPPGNTTKSGYQTKGNLFASPSPRVAKLEQVVKAELTAYYNRFRATPCLLMDRWPDEMRLTGWFVRLLQNGHQDVHIHPSGWLSGVIYLDLPKTSVPDEGSIEFGLRGYDYALLKDGHPTHLHKPQRGEIVLFPSSLFHRTLPFATDGERLSVAFDLLPAGADG